jgi:hypothetical protein
MFGEEAVMLIPAAGFGRRVGAPEAKEMLARPGYAHMIDFCLDQAAQAGVHAHVMLRAAKVSLIQHLESRGREQSISFQDVGETREWPATVLASEPHWRRQNLLMLPDSDFAPTSVIGEMLRSKALTTWAIFSPPNGELSKWGVVDPETGYYAEKPKSLPPQVRQPCAWGLFSFHRDMGLALCRQMLLSGASDVSSWGRLPQPSRFFQLERFADLTRAKAAF